MLGFDVEVDLVAELTVINPFDFFPGARGQRNSVRPTMRVGRGTGTLPGARAPGPLLRDFVASVDRTPRRTIDFLVDLNQRLQHEIEYVIRMEPGVQTCEETLELRRGSCRDSAWLLVQILRHLGWRPASPPAT